MPVELIPGTALPMYAPGVQEQPEGRGTPVFEPGSRGKSLFEKISERDDISAAEAAVVGAALRAFDRAPRHVKHIDQVASGETDATTGNCVIMLMECPAGYELHVTNVIADLPDTAAVTPAAPFANASSWAYLAIAPPSNLPANPAATALRRSMVAFAPSSAAGPILPGNWTFNDSNARIAFGGEAVFYVLVGGSQAGVAGKSVQVSYRFNLLEKS